MCNLRLSEADHLIDDKSYGQKMPGEQKSENKPNTLSSWSILQEDEK